MRNKKNMGFHILVLHLAVLPLVLGAILAQRPKPGCSTKCGDVNIPFPFGTSSDCYLDDRFLVTCNHSFKPPRLFSRRTSFAQILNISLDGYLRISAPLIAKDCYNKSSGLIANKSRTGGVLNASSSNFFFSTTRNKFTVVGCDTVAVVEAVGLGRQNYTTGCLSLCDEIDTLVNGSCSGFGCCQTSLPSETNVFGMGVASAYNHSRVWDFNPCGYAFVVEETAYNFSTLDLNGGLQNRDAFPIVLDWAVRDKGSCAEARKNSSSYACRDIHSECRDSSNGPGYLCSCAWGYQGNPYLAGGCHDIDECEVLKPCNRTCTNLQGNYSCSCPSGYEGDGMRNGTGCYRKNQSRSTVLTIGLGLSIGLIVLFVASAWMYYMYRNRKLMKLKEKFFQQNGGLILQQQISEQQGSIETTVRIFTAEDLSKATNNYDQSRIVGQGGFGIVYRGTLADNRVVAIKKSKISDQSQTEQFVKEVVALSQVNHRNVVKLLGCCLETEVPLLVYEFIGNGTLSHHIHDKVRASAFSWEKRLRIAAETAGAIAYLHSSISPPIIHRDIKSANILLDENFTAKVSDFGASRLVPLDHTQLTTLVQGTFGYLDPEYFQSSHLTEKSDVYSFGVVLAELITGEKALSFNRPEKERNLAPYFVSSMEEGCLTQILAGEVIASLESNFEHERGIKEVAKLAKSCFEVRREDRPTMKEVAIQLEGLRTTEEKHTHASVNKLSPKETEHPLGQSFPIDGGSSSVDDSMKDQIIVPHHDGGR